ncbi:MAG: CopG family transcriptional regulator [Gammaproteobacteria bacterium]|nr:CopG family transcriptional regulator [Gammaproteobacteria bacterium]
MALEDRTARLTILIDPRKKAFFERLCAEEDATPSQVVRRLIRRYIEERTGQPWAPPEEAPKRTPRGTPRRVGKS